MMRWDIINQLIKENDYKSYLEIGYYKGWSFDNVKCEEKTAVDPNPCKTPEQEAWRYGTIGMLSDNESVIKMASDDFFMVKNVKETEIFHWHDFNSMDDKWDIIFIDGLHEAPQVTKDIENSLKYLSPGGTIVLHDCNPPRLEHTTTGIDGCWTGDVYKAAIKLRATTPYKFYTIDTDWGVGILDTTGKPVPFPGTYYQLPWESDWMTFDQNRNLFLNLISPEEFKTGVRFIKDETTTNHNLST